MNSSDASQLSQSAPATGSALLARLKAYRASMAPHHKDREGGKLLLEAIDEIERLQQLLETKTPNMGDQPRAANET